MDQDSPTNGSEQTFPIWKLGLLAFGLVVALFFWCRFDHHPTQRLVIAKGASAHAVAQELKDQGLVLHPWIYLLWHQAFGAQSSARPGIYELNPSVVGYPLFRTLRHGPPLMRVTFPEGWTSKQMA